MVQSHTRTLYDVVMLAQLPWDETVERSETRSLFHNHSIDICVVPYGYLQFNGGYGQSSKSPVVVVAEAEGVVVVVVVVVVVDVELVVPETKIWNLLLYHEL